jgi:Protein of unknown function (DUF2637)
VTGTLRVPRRAALAAIAILVGAASLSSFAESYRALLDWASGHGLHGIWAMAWPLQVDTFIAVGELALFVALADSWSVRSRAAAWTVTALGLAVSVAGNIGHDAAHDWTSRATAAVPPLAAAVALAVGLGVLKRVVAARTAPGPGTAVPEPPAALNGHGLKAAELFADELAAGSVPGIRRIRNEMRVGQPRAQQIRDYLGEVARSSPRLSYPNSFSSYVG